MVYSSITYIRPLSNLRRHLFIEVHFNSYINRNIAIVRTFKTKADFIFTKINYFSFVVKVYGSQSELFHVVQVHANSPKTSKGLLLTQNVLEFCLK